MGTSIVRAGSRWVSVDWAPLPSPSGRLDVPFSLTEPRPGVLVLRTARGYRTLGWVLIAIAMPLLVAFGILLVYAIIFQHRAFPTVLFYFLIAFVFGQYGILLTSPRYLFDSQTGMMTARRFLLPYRRPIADILAVQVVSVGPFNSPGGASPTAWQVNLVLDDPKQPRLLVWSHKGRDVMLAHGRQLAKFLGVRFLGVEPDAK